MRKSFLTPRWTYSTLGICSFCFQHPVLLFPGQGGFLNGSFRLLHEIDHVAAAAKSSWVCMIAGLVLSIDLSDASTL